LARPNQPRADDLRTSSDARGARFSKFCRADPPNPRRHAIGAPIARVLTQPGSKAEIQTETFPFFLRRLAKAGKPRAGGPRYRSLCQRLDGPSHGTPLPEGLRASSLSPVFQRFTTGFACATDAPALSATPSLHRCSDCGLPFLEFVEKRGVRFLDESCTIASADACRGTTNS
jgi:hypothetical protein